MGGDRCRDLSPVFAHGLHRVRGVHDWRVRLQPGQWRKVLLIVILVAAIGAGLVATSDKMSRYVVVTILNPDRNPGVSLRLGVWRDAFRLFRSQPVTGTGLGTFDEARIARGRDGRPRVSTNGWHAHNVYLHVLAETGIVGLRPGVTSGTRSSGG